MRKTAEIYAVQGVSNYDVVFKTEQEGIATHVYAAFEPTLKGKQSLFSAKTKLCAKVRRLTLGRQSATAPTSTTRTSPRSRSRAPSPTSSPTRPTPWRPRSCGS